MTQCRQPPPPPFTLPVTPEDNFVFEDILRMWAELNAHTSAGITCKFHKRPELRFQTSWLRGRRANHCVGIVNNTAQSISLWSTSFFDKHRVYRNIKTTEIQHLLYLAMIWFCLHGNCRCHFSWCRGGASTKDGETILKKHFLLRVKTIMGWKKKKFFQVKRSLMLLRRVSQRTRK